MELQPGCVATQWTFSETTLYFPPSHRPSRDPKKQLHTSTRFHFITHLSTHMLLNIATLHITWSLPSTAEKNIYASFTSIKISDFKAIIKILLRKK